MKVEYNSPVILTYAIICAVVLVVDRLVGGHLMGYFTVPGAFQGFSVTSVFQLFSHVIGHGDAGHLLGNFTMILLIGPIVEEKYGSWLLLAMILLTALITGLLNILLTSTGLLGASGVVFMLIVLSSFTNVQNGKIPLTFILVVLLFLGTEVTKMFEADAISQATHIFGGLCGTAFGFGIHRFQKLAGGRPQPTDSTASDRTPE